VNPVAPRRDIKDVKEACDAFAACAAEADRHYAKCERANHFLQICKKRAAKRRA
jgi:hypothetical protein